MNKVIGIDLGTGNSCVAVMQHGEVKVIQNSQGGRTTPSVFAITKQQQSVVGQLAKRQAITNPKNTVYSIKRLIGHQYNSVKDEKLAYTVKENDKHQAVVSINDRDYTPQQISAQILKKMKETAEAYLGHPVTDAVITVPAYFGDDQRTATKDAGRIAGLNVLRIINEPTAAALSYGIDKHKNQKVAVVDFGSGTYDISILDISGGIIQVLSTNGNTRLGGDDIDNIIINWILSEFNKTDGIDLSKDPMALQRVKQAAEKTKIDLSGQFNSNINLPFITADASGPKHLDLTLSRANFQNMISDVLKKLLIPCQIALKDAKLSIKDIQQVLLVGGSTRIPAVQQTIKKFFNKEPNKSLNPDEVVAMGAAIQGAILSGEQSVKDILLLDVTPLSLGIQTVGGVMTKIIDKNTTIPTNRKQVFSTAADNQPAVTIHVLQGERPLVADNTSLGRFDLVDIPLAPRGVPQIEVQFDIDSNGIIHVSAKDVGTGKSQSIKIQRSGQLTKDQIDAMIRQAEMHAQEDAKKREYIEAKNNLQSLLFTTQNTLNTHRGSLPNEIVQSVELAVQSLNKNINSYSTAEQLNKQYTEFSQKVRPMMQILHKQKQQVRQSEESREPNKDKTVIDADFEVVD